VSILLLSGALTALRDTLLPKIASGELRQEGDAAVKGLIRSR